jgi:hypothetical protein
MWFLGRAGSGSPMLRAERMARPADWRAQLAGFVFSSRTGVGCRFDKSRTQSVRC